MTAYLFYVFALVIIFLKLNTCDTLSLAIVLKWSSENQSFKEFVFKYTAFTRNVLRTKRVFALQAIPQEKDKGEDGSPAGWISKGTLEFKDAYLRYRPNCDLAL